MGSVQGVTESGDLVIVSASSSQLGPYASGAGRLILVVGSQKIVRDVDEAMRRIEDVVFPYEDALVRERMNIGTFIGKVLIIRREWIDGQMTVVQMREPPRKLFEKVAKLPCWRLYLWDCVPRDVAMNALQSPPRTAR